jgi:hypothetical protein
MEGTGEWNVFMVTNCFCKRDVRRVRLDRERALPLLHSVPVIKYFQMLTIIPVYAMKRENFRR